MVRPLAVIGGSADHLSVTDRPDFISVFSAGDDELYARIGRRATTFDIAAQ